jgi:hypothetical protein
MARSYFSRLVRGGESALLAPTRPVTNLWKTVQIDAAVPAPDASPISTSYRSPIQRSRIAEPVPSSTEVESRPVPQISPAKPVEPSSRTQAPPISDHGETARSAPAAETTRRPEVIRQDATTRQDGVIKATQRHAGPVVQAREIAAPAVTAASPSPYAPTKSVSAQSVPAQSVPARPVSSRREPATQPVGPTPSARPLEAKPVPKESRLPDTVEPIPPVARRAAEKQPTSAPMSAPKSQAAETVHAAPAPITPAPVAAPENPAPRTQAVLQPIEWATPMRSREPSRAARQTSTPEQPRANGNTVQIEVQVIPPPAPSYRPMPAAQPKARLARGYSLWQGW